MATTISIENCWFQNILCHLKFDFYSDGKAIKWVENEPALNEEALCMVMILDNINDDAVLRAKLDKCDKAVHNFVCITYPCGNQSVGCWRQHPKVHKEKGQENAILFPPKLEIR